MKENVWNGGREDPRLYSRVRAEKQRILVAHYEGIRPFLDEREGVSGRPMRRSGLVEGESVLLPKLLG